MDKPASGKLYEQAANQNKEADSHAHKVLDEVSAWFKCSVQANQTNTEALQQNMKEGIDTANNNWKQGCDSISKGFHNLTAELKREDPELVQFLHKAKHAPETAVHRIADFYRTRPVTAAIETIIPPIAIVDGIVRGGLHDHRALVATSENTQKSVGEQKRI
ncbi:MAG TPA: hypothetical protein V6C97_00400 [Oculatellaceae cyanobacterium]